MTEISKRVTSDYWIEENERSYAGAHVLLDIHETHNLDCVATMEKTLRDAVERAGATLLHLHLHHFGPGLGVSGVAVLSESHISVHTWPERGFAAFDIFMCGHSNPMLAVEVIQASYPGKQEVSHHRRGERVYA